MKAHGWKRTFDVVASLAAIVVLSPVLAGTAIAVRARSGRPVLFRQRRPGLDGAPFEILKFRTMTEEQDASGRLLPDAARLTWLGSVLRATSLDELPQLWNVLVGDMSLVGPRPLLERYLPYYTERERLRHTVRPGITGWAQVNGRNATGWDERLELDAWYVEHLSPGLDLRILWRTVRGVLRREGVEVVPGAALQDLDAERRQVRPRSPGIRPARPEDAEQIVHIARAGVPGSVLPYTPFGAARAAAFVRDRLSRPGAEVLVAGDGTQVTGFAEFRHVGGELFLNDIYVRGDQRGAGIGAALLRAGIELFRRPDERGLSLDVFEESAPAMRWYRALGLEAASSFDWRVAMLPLPRRGTGWKARGLETAELRHDALGVTEFEIHRAAHRYTVGWIDAYRVRSEAILADRAALEFLASLRQARRLLCIARPEEFAAAEPVVDSALVARSSRMSGPIERVVTRLAPGWRTAAAQ